MVITDKFVYIHMPKTGGTFVTSVLFRIHNSTKPTSTRYNSAYRLLLSVLHPSRARLVNSLKLYGEIVDLEPKHGTCHEIPEQHRNKPILSTIRTPYDWYVSQYEFGWWKRTFLYHPESHPTPAGFAIEHVLPEFIVQYPHFPDISFQEFVDLCNKAALVFNSECDTDLGLYTHSFVRFYYREAAKVISRIDWEYVCSGRHKLDMFNVDFIKTDRLNQELYGFLLSIGYRAEDLRFLPALGKILPMGRGRRKDQHWEKYYAPSLKEFIREKDWALFEMFPDFDI
jgi:hypothetical protein